MLRNQHLVTGNEAENQALRLLSKQGLKLVERNFKARGGELDLIMLDLEQLVIVEVRFRKNASFGSAAETVNPGKQRRIITATQQFLIQHPQHANRSIRFDIVALQADRAPQWIQDAFQTT